MQDGNQGPPNLGMVMSGLKDVLLEELDQKWPGAKRLAKEIDEETKPVFEMYRKETMTEIHATRLVNLILNDLTNLQLNEIIQARALLLQVEELLFRHLISEARAREMWAQRHELKARKMEAKRAEEEEAN